MWDTLVIVEKNELTPAMKENRDIIENMAKCHIIFVDSLEPFKRYLYHRGVFQSGIAFGVTKIDVRRAYNGV